MKTPAFFTLLLATAGLATAAPDIAVEGDDGAGPGWPNIYDSNPTIRVTSDNNTAFTNGLAYAEPLQTVITKFNG
jgi:hypothetical protein